MAVDVVATANSLFILGGNDWVADLSPDMTEYTLSPTVNTAGDATIGNEFIRKALTSWGRNLDVASIYYGDAADVARPHSNGVVIVGPSDKAFWVGGDFHTNGFTQSAGADDLLSEAFGIMPTDKWVTGTIVKDFATNTDAQSVTVGMGEADSLAYIVLLSKTGAATAQYTLDNAAAQPVASGPRVVGIAVGAAELSIVQSGAGSLQGYAFIGKVEGDRP